MKNRRLGRGLDFLLSASDPDEQPSAGTREIRLGEISPNPWQPRSEFDEGSLEELASSIRQVGLVQPILVRAKDGGGYELIAGERRLIASRRAGLESVPAVVRDADDQEMLTLALVENIHRKDLDPVERARAFQRLHQEQSLSHKQIADVAGLARSTVTNALRLLELDDSMLGAVEAGKITEGHARTLLAEADPERRNQLFQELVTGKMSVREAEDVVSNGPSRAKSGKGGKRSPEAEKLEQDLNDHLGLKVTIKESGQRGKVIIHYRSLEDFDRLYKVITGGRPEM